MTNEEKEMYRNGNVPNDNNSWGDDIPQERKLERSITNDNIEIDKLRSEFLHSDVCNYKENISRNLRSVIVPDEKLRLAFSARDNMCVAKINTLKEYLNNDIIKYELERLYIARKHSSDFVRELILNKEYFRTAIVNKENLTELLNDLPHAYVKLAQAYDYNKNSISDIENMKMTDYYVLKTLSSGFCLMYDIYTILDDNEIADMLKSVILLNNLLICKLMQS